MYNYTPNDAFPAARLLDTSDPVQGGASAAGADNEPLVKLADRTEYLNNRLGRYLGHRIVTANAIITPADTGKLVQAVKNANMTLTMDPVATFKVGQWIDIKAKITATANTGKAVLIAANGSEAILDGNFSMNTSPLGLYICDGELVRLVACDADGNNVADYWEVELLKTNYEKAGLDDLVRYRPRNTIIADGLILLNRADFPRVAAVVLAEAISDATWTSDIRYQQFWSTGNGTTTMRTPDMRSMVHKGLDLGRGLSLTRLDNIEGGLELDGVKSHDHDLPIDGGSFTDRQSLTTTPNADEGLSSLNKTGLTGGVENLIKTVGLIPIIYY